MSGKKTRFGPGGLTPMTRGQTGRALAGLAALGFLGTAVLHGSGTSVVRLAEGGPGVLRQVLPALWLAFSLDLTVVGLIVAVTAFRPDTSSRAILVVASACPFGAAALQLRYIGFVPPTAILITVGLLTMAGAAALPPPPGSKGRA